MVLGTTRERPITEGQDVAPGRTAEEWRAERGAVRWEGGGDLAGGFPGFAARGARLLGVQVRLTDYYLLVEEGRPHGFGLPLPWLIGADLYAPPRTERTDPALRLRYDDGAAVRTFQIRFRGSLLGPSGGRRAEQVLAALQTFGLGEAGEPLPGSPEFAVSWDEAARFEGENVIWSGHASAILGPTGERAPCDVWLTTRSVIWGSRAGSGILRLPIEAVIDAVPAELADRAGTPAVYVAATDDHGGRHEVPFVFDRHSPAQRNHRERGAFLVGLRSRGVPLGAIPAPPQPWRDPLLPQAPLPSVSMPETPAADRQGRGSGRSTSRRPAPTGRFRPRPLPADIAEGPGRWERAMAEWTGQPGWSDPPPTEQPDATEPTVREQLRSLLGEALPDPGAGDDARERPARGVILPWPNHRRGNRRSIPPDTESVEAQMPPAPTVLPELGQPMALEEAATAPAEVAVSLTIDAAGAEFLPFAGSWPIPPGFLGAVTIEAAPLDVEEATSAETPSEPSATSEADASAAAVGESEPAVDTSQDDPRAALRRYEAAVLRAITDALRAIESGSDGSTAPAAPPPNAAERAAAFAALDTLVVQGDLTAEGAVIHRALLVTAGEAGPRLRSLLELREAGYLAADDLDRKRRQIVAPLADLLSR